MISVIVMTLNSAAGLQTLLPPLVPAAVDGLVREVIAADAGSTDATLEICEDAGVKVVAGGLIAAASAARGDLVLILPDDLMLRPGWDERLRAHLTQGRDGAVIVGDRPIRFMGRFAPRKQGLLIDRQRLTGRAETRDLSALVRALGRGAKRL